MVRGRKVEPVTLSPEVMATCSGCMNHNHGQCDKVRDNIRCLCSFYNHQMGRGTSLMKHRRKS